MTEDDVKKLVRLQEDIKQLKKTMEVMNRHKFRITFPNYSSYEEIPLHKVPGLEEQAGYLFKEMISDRLEELEESFNSLALCRQVTGGPSYIPTELK